MSEENEAMVRRLVETINAGKEDATVEQLFAPMAARRVKRLSAEFRSAFPNWHEEVVDTVAGRFRCSGTHLGNSLGFTPVISLHLSQSGLWVQSPLRVTT